jgi:hypothetical protein
VVIIPLTAQLTPWPDELPTWESRTAEEKKLFARQAEVFAGYTAYTDREIGRIIQQVEDMGKLDNTLIIYICGDNGTSPEGTLLGTPNQMTAYNGILDVPVGAQLEFYDSWGSAATYPHMAVAWSWAFDTPFKWTKQIASHFGGTRQGLAISWPARIKDVGGVRSQFHHIIDIVPTILEAAGLKQPEVVNGIEQKPIEGVSMTYTFDKANTAAPTTHTTQYFEMVANRGIYHDGWYANTVPPVPPWVLNAPMPDVSDYRWGFIISPRTIPSTTTSRRKCRRDSKKCRRFLSKKRRSIMFFHWITRSSRAPSRHAQVRPRDRQSSPTRGSWPAFRSATRRAFSTGRTRSPPRSKSLRAATG